MVTRRLRPGAVSWETWIPLPRSTGAQTIVPPSTHPTGEELVWERFDEPATVSAQDLVHAAEATAAAALAAKVWKPGLRHHATLALAGAMLRNGWDCKRTELFIRAVCRAASDEEEDSRLRDIATTAARLKKGELVTGLPTLQQVLGDVIGNRLAQWLHLQNNTLSVSRPQSGIGMVERSTPPLLENEALYGLAGDIVRVIDPHTESHPVAVLIQLLVAFGNVIGRRPHFRAEADYHAMNLFVTIVGDSAKARKGSSWGHIRRLFQAIDPGWAESRIRSGMSSGEGLIWAVRNPIEKQRATKAAAGEEPQFETVIEDAGEEDKRLLCVESEFASVLKNFTREGNIPSATVRQAWDSGDLSTLTKNSPARASGAHISIIGHITREELRRYLNDTEIANGFANRFIFLFVTRSKLLPEGGNLHTQELEDLRSELAESVRFARECDELRRDEEARQVWSDIYAHLSEAKPGLAGSLLARAEAQVMRLACLYALLDRSHQIRAEHLLAAIALWDYAEDSVFHIFGRMLGDETADTLLQTLINQPRGLTRTQIRDLFGRNRRSGDIGRALGILAQQGLAYCVGDETDGRPAERWFAAEKATT